MFCNNCGTYNRDGANFCSKCGAKFSLNQFDNNINTEDSELVDSILEKWNTNDYDSDDSSAPKNKKRIEVAFTIVAAIVMLSIGFYAAINDIFVKHNESLKNEKSYVDNRLYNNEESTTEFNEEDEDNDDDNYYLDKNDNKIYYDESTTITDPKTTVTTTTAEPIMPYSIGEEITITSTIDGFIADIKRINVNADNVVWYIDCDNVENFDKLITLCNNKEVKFIGNVTDDFIIILTSVVINGKIYKIEDFQLNPTLYEDDNVKIQYYKIGKDENGDDDAVIFKVTNKRDFQITIQCDSIALDGEQIDGYPTMSDDVAPQSIAKVYAQYDYISNKNPSKISGVLNIIDFSSEHFDDMSYDASFVDIAL